MAKSSTLVDQPRAFAADCVNVADRLKAIAAQTPDAIAVATPGGSHRAGVGRYSTCTFADLDRDADALARGLVDLGVRRGMRMVLLVRPGVEFVKLVFALLRSGATTLLVDPGMGRSRLIDCLAAAAPDGFIAVSAAQAARVLHRGRFEAARFNVTVGRRWFWGGPTFARLLESGRTSSVRFQQTRADDSAAIIFTSGSTGPPKGVLYTHRMFDAQVAEIQQAYQLASDGVDLACFALFGLFNSAMGVTTVFPEMDFSRPASADSRKLLAAANDWRVTQAFASPAVWDKLGRHGEQTGEKIPSLRKIFSCGAPVSAAILRRTLAMAHPEAEMHTPYGATEALPVSTIEAREILGETAAKTHSGAGVCVGRKFDSIEWRVIRISDDPLPSIDQAETLPPGEIGELAVRGPQVSPHYVIDEAWRASNAKPAQQHDPQSASARSRDGNSLAKIRDGGGAWHRMGDVGYLDDQGRFWYCGRKSQRVETSSGPLFTGPVESVFDTLPGVKRSALVGVRNGACQSPVVIIEPVDAALARQSNRALALQREAILSWYEVEPRLVNLWYAHHGYAPLRAILFHEKFPVDARHNSKINREVLAAWAEAVLVRSSPPRPPSPLDGQLNSPS